MSNLINDQIIEGLADEFYDDPKGCMDWLVLFKADEGSVSNIVEYKSFVEGLSEEDQCELYVNQSMEVMAQ